MKRKEEIVLVNPSYQLYLERKGIKANFFDLERNHISFSQVYSSYSLENLGLSYLSSFLNENDVPNTIIDSCLEDISINEIIDKISKISPICVGIAITPPAFREVVNLVQKIKELDIPVMIGSQTVTVYAKEILQNIPSIDYAIVGEGEKPLFNLFQYLNGECKKENVRSVFFNNNGKITFNGYEEPFWDLDQLPLPNHYGIPFLEKYKMSIPIMTSRGCLYNCNFCINNLLDDSLRKYRRRSNESLLKEIDFLISSGVSDLTFIDSLFINKSSKSIEMCKELANELINRDFDIRFTINSRAEIFDDEVYCLLKKAGLRSIYIGFESYNQRILNLYNKKITITEINKTIELMDKLDIPIIPGIITFDPFSEYDEIYNTYLLCKKIKYCDFRKLTNPLRIYQKSALTNSINKEQINYSESDIFNLKYNFHDKRIDLLKKYVDDYYLECVNIIHQFYENNNEVKLIDDEISQKIVNEQFEFFDFIFNKIRNYEIENINQSFKTSIRKLRNILSINS
ncbi:MAG: B12-binding domain-containing radical SAM protein [Candidatus Heimdallarchaeota archaeon]|nr:B12-binding domain-containing radical SAM protein [Candidatus Heimdallarchaeota archaeon]